MVLTENEKVAGIGSLACFGIALAILGHLTEARICLGGIFLLLGLPYVPAAVTGLQRIFLKKYKEDKQ